MKAIHGLTTLAILMTPLFCHGQGTITTVAGIGSTNFSGDGGPATSAAVLPTAVTLDGAGNIYIADTSNVRIREVTTDGIINTIAGNGIVGLALFGSIGDGGPATMAEFGYSTSYHQGVAVDGAGNLYIADGPNNRVRMVDSAGIMHTLAGQTLPGFSGDGGPATSAQMWNPTGVAVDSAGNLYIADGTNLRIRKVDTNGIMTTVAGIGKPTGLAPVGDGGPATSAALGGPVAVAVDSAGNLYIADTGLSQSFSGISWVRKVDTSGTITTVAGGGGFGFSGDGGPATSAFLNTPSGLAVDGAGNLYIADSGNNRVRMVDTNGIITTVAGNGSSLLAFGLGGSITPGDGGPATAARLSADDVALDAAGNIYIAGGGRIRMVSRAKQ
jgi:sugar lactone lactonase YvrE